jgi:nucleotide-binding universal stress UspA family protein
MIEINRILCPVDFSDFSRRALDHAVSIARWYDAGITALYVYQPVPVPAYAPGPVPFAPVILTAVDRDALTAELTKFIEAESAEGVTITPLLREGSPPREILDEATAGRADLLVMGTHGRSGFERLLLGSVAEKILRKAPCPVLTVPRHHPDAVPATAVQFKQIICPVDFSPSSMRALTYALSMAQEADAALTVLHVLSPDVLDVPGASPESHLTLAEFHRHLESDARRLLAEAVPAAASAYCRAETRLVRGKPWQEILRTAAERQADLIVMGVQGRSAADLMLFGSTTQQVLREAVCPVLTLRPA